MRRTLKKVLWQGEELDKHITKLVNAGLHGAEDSLKGANLVRLRFKPTGESTNGV
jgi:hypothetical protein